MYLCLFLPFYLETFQIKIYEIHEDKHEKKKKDKHVSSQHLFPRPNLYFLKSFFVCPHFKTLHNSIQTPLNHCILTLVGI